MTTEPLPTFRYHPDPIATESVEPSDAACESCGRARGLVISGNLYAVADVVAVCPWCVADGSAAARFDGQFTDVGWGVPDDVPASVVAEISTRTPGFVTWQGDHWLYHCADGAAFLGRVGWAELQAHPDVIDALCDDPNELGLAPEDLDRDGSATGYLFRCLHCGQHLAYTDVE